MFESPVIEAMASAQQIFADFTNSKSMSIAPQNALSKKSWPRMPFPKTESRVSHVEKKLLPPPKKTTFLGTTRVVLFFRGNSKKNPWISLSSARLFSHPEFNLQWKERRLHWHLADPQGHGSIPKNMRSAPSNQGGTSMRTAAIESTVRSTNLGDHILKVTVKVTSCSLWLVVTLSNWWLLVISDHCSDYSSDYSSDYYSDYYSDYSSALSR